MLSSQPTDIAETLKNLSIQAESQVDTASTAAIVEQLQGKHKAEALRTLAGMNLHESLAIDSILPALLVACADKAAPIRADAETIATTLVSRISSAAGMPLAHLYPPC